MTQRTNARVAGITFLLYIIAGITSMVLMGSARKGDGTAAKLASLVQHESTVRLVILITIFIFAVAMTLAVTLYALTRHEDRDLAILALAFRATEAFIAAIAAVKLIGLLAVAKAASKATAADAAAWNAVGGSMLSEETGTVAAICFALGSTVYCYLFLKARSIPVALSWLGLVASILLAVVLPLRLGAVLTGSYTMLVWLPMLVFEVGLAFWLIFKGVSANHAPIAEAA